MKLFRRGATDPDPVTEILDCAVIHYARELVEQAETSLAAGPHALLGEEVWEGWSLPDRERAVMDTRMGFAMRLAEVELFAEASNYNDPDWLVVIDVVLRHTADPSNQDNAAYPSMSAAAFFAQEPDTIDALFQTVPGPSAELRYAVIDRWFTQLHERNFPLPAGTVEADAHRLMVYGYALAVVRQVMLTAQELGDAGRQGRSPNV